MHKNQANFNANSKFSVTFSKYTVFLLGIISLALVVRFYFFPFEVPLNSDALYYFWYSSDIFQIGELPNDWSPINNGWPIFVSLFFSVFDGNDIRVLMSVQRALSVIISVAISIPVYFLCKKFVERKFAIIGVVFIAFDPRLMINSFLGVTDPLYLLLITSSLTLFLFSNKKIVYFSFAIVALSTLIRGEGIVFFVALSVIFFIRYRNEKYKIFLKYVLIIGIFTLVILPLSLYRIDVVDSDGIFMRSISSTEQLLTNVVQNEKNNLVFGFELLIKYLIWIMIPNFIIFMPLGIFLIFQKRSFENMTIIISMGAMLIPALYAYSVPALDTRYLYVLFPMFVVLAVLTIKKIAARFDKDNILIVIVISSIIISSLVFYDQQKINYEHEKESFEVMNKISTMIKGTNILYPESSYFSTSQTINQWPKTFTETKFDIITIPTNNYNSLEEFIIESQNTGLTHIIMDNNMNRQEFLSELFFDDTKYTYLKKIYDSKIDGYNYQVKVFEINYELFNSLKDNMVLIQK